MIYGLIFDMDGVVIDSNPFHKIAWRDFLVSRGVPFDDNLFDNVLSGRTGPTSLRMLFGDDLPEEVMEEYLAEVDQGYQTILRNTVQVPSIAGVHAFIAEVSKAGHRLALATSAPPLNIEMGLEKLGLEGVFDVIVGKVDVEHGKPHPEVYLTSVEKLGLPAGRCLVFEDSRAGIQSALQAGLPVIGVASSHSGDELLEEGASLVIDDFTGLKLDMVLDLIRNR